MTCAGGRRRGWMIGVVWALTLLARAADAGPFHVGAWAEDITPESWPISLAGSMADQTATKVHDPIHARSLVIGDGETRVAIVICDSCMIPRETMDEAKRRVEQSVGIPASHILIAATHSHTCPTSAGVFQSEPDVKYRTLLIERIADSVATAASNAQRAEVGVASGSCPGEVFNRRWKMAPGSIPADPFGRTTDTVQMNPPLGSPSLVEPAGSTDPEVFLLGARSQKGDRIAALANYSLHYVGGVPAGEVSADYFGEFCRRFARNWSRGDAAPVVLLSNGTSGDINNINFRGPRLVPEPFGQIQHVASEVAKVAAGAAESMSFVADGRVSARVREIELGVRRPTSEEVEEARAILAETSNRPLRSLREIYARETVLLAEYPSTVKLWIQAMRVGPAAVVAIPCEVFVEIGLDLKNRSPIQPLAIIELANGYNGYLPTRAQHQLGGYETWRARSSYLEVGAAETIVATALGLLNELSEE